MMRALPELLRRRPQARVLIVGGDGVSYGAKAPEGETWKGVYSAEVRDQISDEGWSRVHFVGHVPYERFVPLLQLSTVHIYLTYPFVLSWSLLEAMSAGCAIVASDTQPVREAIRHDDTGLLIDFFSPSQLVDSVCTLLEDPSTRARFGARAREFACAHYDLQSICLPRQLEWVGSLGVN
jgi:glycosyltransferase involved in cell wall biosynthesis